MSKNTILALILGLGLSLFISFQFIPAFQKPIAALRNLQKDSVEASANVLIKPTAEPLGTILFVSDKDKNKEIYEMNLDTKEIVNLTNNAAQDMNPQISPDGRFMVFYSNRSGQNKIYRMTLSDKTVTQLTSGNGDDYDPSYATDGQKIVFKSTRDDHKGDIFIMNEDGSEVKNLTKNRASTEEWDPIFSNDNETIYFVVRNSNHLSDELYSMSVDGSKVTQITKNAVPDWYPTINRNTGDMIYISKSKSDALDSLFVMKIDTKTNGKQITKTTGNDADPAWNTSGSRIVFINDQDGNYDLYMMNADGSKTERILQTEEDELSPVFLPL